MNAPAASMGSVSALRLALPIRLDATNADTVSRELMACLRESAAGQLAEVDAAALQSFDSSALATLLALQRLATEKGSRLELRAAPTRLVELAHLYGIQDVLLPHTESMVG